ncbi:DUF1353 domain-containing protein [Agrobacterium vitis]|uniref:DUF1353 domain-containing protein n=1 Tax=Allorhizobium ampelinum TaxID=3025782 RepID=UPI0012E6FED6|nr:DUF1353 domain-containing protein [Allorhizobium ampelinum]MCF1465037.1 DUF1353 domain-containing protein [Allorhizobium ampelinum]MCF1494003.1 DUF1353 domain-containing protein [Allorhizobium ampelinum]MVA46662.1 DUF1353 domain-containing protein [Agrobacterium vitis]
MAYARLFNRFRTIWAICLSLLPTILIAFPATAVDYRDVGLGEIKGVVTIQWLEPDVFLFIPDNEKPLTFIRPNGQVITPKRMITDGGSIPRPMWAFRSYSPWGYAPAFIIHDWLFHAKNCDLADAKDYDLDTAGLTMGEVIKTLMETKRAEKDEFTVGVMMAAVTSRFARSAWEKGTCIPAPPAFDNVPTMEYRLEFK